MPKISLSMIDNSPKPAERRNYGISDRQGEVLTKLYDRGMSWLAYAAKQMWEGLERVPVDQFPEDLQDEIVQANEDIIR